MSILVFGAKGQIAVELARHAEVTALGRSSVDLTVPEIAAEAIAVHAPSVVINAAAYTAVDKAESEEAAAQVLNTDAPGVMAIACADRGIPFLHISTDYVFDGSGSQPWRETDPTAPLGVYGRTKLAGEDAVRAAGGRWAILRTAWVFSSHGTNFVKTVLRLAETRDRMDIVADQWGGPTPAASVAATLLHMAAALRDGHEGGLYHYTGAPDTTWADFARAIFAAAGRSVAVADIPASAYPTPAARPANARLDCSAIKRDFGIERPDWSAGLSDVLKELAA
jgi:dTDP-4-dehydrorhamnose reductase